MSTTIFPSLLHSIENFIAYLFTPFNTHLSSSAQQFLIISSACFTGIMIFSFLNKAVNTFGALLTHITIHPETLLNQAIGEFEAIPTSAETFLSQAFCKYEAVRNYNTIKNEKDTQDCKTVLRNKKALWQPTAGQKKYILMALYGMFLTCYFAYVIVEFEGWVREGILVLSGLSLVNVGVLRVESRGLFVIAWGQGLGIGIGMLGALSSDEIRLMANINVEVFLLIWEFSWV
ncbi:uncharacterized protein Bfra_006522 [Botrytis fragariae]|uniref:Uncharacterized protein n=1 Tax=Botrytis fragariae TaxID=1964551 RepID=A0A8H6EP59_9HELO|nr:uncharacterized protein Bfra_006522 [Botrytis fragariae]KAF5879314.1 hypothetical protein Bfra_006522 [Botrytis fragariae]